MATAKTKAKKTVTVHCVFSNKHILTDEAKAMLICVLDNAKRLIIEGKLSDIDEIGILAGHLRDIVFLANDCNESQCKYFNYGCNGDTTNKELCKELQTSDEHEFPWDEVLSDHLQAEIE